MDLSIAGFLLLDGATNAAVYALMALGLVLVFSVTRVILIPLGELLSFSALSLAAMQQGQRPMTIHLLLLMALLSLVLDLFDAWRRGLLASMGRALVLRALPGLLTGLFAWCAAPRGLPLPVQAGLSMLLITALAPLLYRLAYQPLADASVLVLLIVSVALHVALSGLGLVFFGPEGARNPSFWDAQFALGPLNLQGQQLIIFGVVAALVAGLWLMFGISFYGKALRASAVNPLGARLMGISSQASGRAAFALAGFIAALSGLLISPTMTIAYDSGFLIGLKGFVAAVFGGLGSYPAAALGALLLGQIEAFSAFWASAYKDALVFSALLPVLLWRSLRDPQREEH